MAEAPAASGALGPEEDAARDFALRALDVAADVAGPGAQIAATVEVGTSSLTRFAQSAIHQSVSEEVRQLTLAVTLDGRTAEVSGSAAGWPGADGLRRLATAALTSARLRPVDPHWPGLAPPAPVGPSHADRATADATDAERAALVAAFVEAAGGLETAGFCATRGTATAFVNSAGQQVTGSVTLATVDGIARAPSGEPAPADGSGRASSTRLRELWTDRRRATMRGESRSRRPRNRSTSPPANTSWCCGRARSSTCSRGWGRGCPPDPTRKG